MVDNNSEFACLLPFVRPFSPSVASISLAHVDELAIRCEPLNVELSILAESCVAWRVLVTTMLPAGEL